MRAYSSDLRERIGGAVDQGRSPREAARPFGVGVSSVKRYLQQRAQTGSLARWPIPGGVRRIGGEQEAVLRARVAAAPEVTLAELCAWWEAQPGQRGSGPMMWWAIRRLEWTRKAGRDEAARAAWREVMSPVDVRRLVLVDESRTHSALVRLFA